MADESIFWRVGRFILDKPDIDGEQLKMLNIFGQCIILEAKPLSPIFFMPDDVNNKIVYTARSYEFERIKRSMKNIPWYIWTYEKDELMGNIDGKSWQAMKIKAPALSYK